MTARSNLARLLDFGQSFWWDALSRKALRDGTVARMRDEDGMRGITSNPSIFHQAISSGDDYDGRIRELSATVSTPEEMFWLLAIEDIQQACDVLRPVYDDSDGADGFVSLEVSPHFAFDAEATLQQVRELWGRVDRPNLMIKIPGTPEGVGAIRQSLIEGFNVNVTLLFSPRAHIDVMNAYIEALQVRVEQGKPVDRMASVASFFVSRVDSLIDSRLEAMGTPEALALRGQAGNANAKVAYANFVATFGSEAWQALVEAGARVQRPLWASTSTKNPDYSDVMYVDTLIGQDTVNTLPTNTVDAFRDHGQLKANAVTQGLPDARRLFEGLKSVGISMDEVTTELLQDGVQKFEASFDALLADLQSKMDRISLAARE